MARQSMVRFEVEVVEHRGTKRERRRWLRDDGGWTENRDEAVVFVMRRGPKNGERPKIALRCHEIAGGTKAWMDLEANEPQAWMLLLAKYHAEIWGEDGKPPSESEEEDTAQWKQIEDAYARDNSPLAEAYRAMHRQVEEIRFMAGWPILIVAPQHPDDDPNPNPEPWRWADIAEIEDDPPGILQMLMRAHGDALAKLEETRGN